MIQLGAVYIDPAHTLDKTFYGEFAPLNNKFVQGALDVVGVTYEQTKEYPQPRVTIGEFRHWLMDIDKNLNVYFISDNNGFDWQFVNWYFHHFRQSNPFGHSSTNLGSLYKGLAKSSRKSFKKYRKTKHTHNPVDDAMGNVEALIYMIEKMGLDWKL